MFYPRLIQSNNSFPPSILTLSLSPFPHTPQAMFIAFLKLTYSAVSACVSFFYIFLEFYVIESIESTGYNHFSSYVYVWQERLIYY